MSITLNLTEPQARALRELAEEYLCKGGPAWECMQEWPMPHASADLAALKDEILLRIK
jgi:hypothetical protein